MCRLFALRSTVPASCEDALLLAKNALSEQSREHPDGWGIATYEGERPLVTRGLLPAHADDAFLSAARRATGRTVLAHVRKASIGPRSDHNTHPFTCGRWTFAHNGTLPDFHERRSRLEAAIAPAHRATLRGDTDSERLFGLFLTHLARRGDPHGELGIEAVLGAMDDLLREVNTLFAGAAKTPSVNVLVTDGRLLAACRQGRTLHVSTRRATSDGAVPLYAASAHLLVASEPIGVGAEWHELAEGEAVACDGTGPVVRTRLAGALLPVADAVPA